MVTKTLLIILFIIFVGIVLISSKLQVPQWAIVGLFLLVCPLSMAFMHGGHDHGDKPDESEKDSSKNQHRH
jgi:hypothetical protein